MEIKFAKLKLRSKKIQNNDKDETWLIITDRVSKITRSQNMSHEIYIPVKCLKLVTSSVLMPINQRIIIFDYDTTMEDAYKIKTFMDFCELKGVSCMTYFY